MKLPIIALSVLCLTNAFAAERFDAATWKSVQTYNVPTLLNQETSLLGRVVAVRFHNRSEKLRHLRPNWYEASIWQRDPNAKKGVSGLRVMVAKPDVPAFQTITFDFNSPAEVTVYARVEKDPETNLTHLRLLGRKITTDAGGNVTVGW